MNLCKRFRNLFSDYIENALDKAQRELVQSHLDQCADCQAIVRRLKRVKSILSVFSKIGISPDFDTILRTRIRIETSLERKSIFEKLFSGQARIPAYAISVAVIFLVAFIIWNQSGSNNESDKSRRVATSFAPYATQEVALADSDLNIYYIDNKTFYEIGLMYLSSPSNDSLQRTNKHGKVIDSLLFHERIEHYNNMKNYQPVQQVSF